MPPGTPTVPSRWLGCWRNSANWRCSLKQRVPRTRSGVTVPIPYRGGLCLSAVANCECVLLVKQSPVVAATPPPPLSSNVTSRVPSSSDLP